MNAICTTCGTQFADSSSPPEHCAICEEERQFVGLDGQRWTTLEELRSTHHIKSQTEEHGLTSFVIEPRFGIGQRAFLIQTSEGNVLWDCVSLLDDATTSHIRSLGGLKAICISHPHYYTSLVEWSQAFENAPVYLHRDDAQWVMRPDSCIKFWDGERKALPAGMTLIRCGGHFDGACVLHWPDASAGKGAILTADTIQVVPDRKSVSFMYSYPNFVPVNASAVERIVAAVEPFAFDRFYGAFPQLTIFTGAREVLDRSARRYVRAIGAITPSTAAR